MDTGATTTELKMAGISVGAGEILLRADNTDYEERIEVLGRRILGKRCINENLLDNNGDVLIYFTDETLDPDIWSEEHQWFRVLKVGEECRYLTQKLVDSNAVYMKWALFGDKIHDIGESLWMVDERLIDQGENVCPALYIYPKD